MSSRYLSVPCICSFGEYRDDGEIPVVARDTRMDWFERVQ